MESVTPVQILDAIVFVSLHANAFGKGMNLFILSQRYGLIVGKNMFFRIGQANSPENGKLYLSTPKNWPYVSAVCDVSFG